MQRRQYLKAASTAAITVGGVSALGTTTVSACSSGYFWYSCMWDNQTGSSGQTKLEDETEAGADFLDAHGDMDHTIYDYSFGSPIDVNAYDYCPDPGWGSCPGGERDFRDDVGQALADAHDDGDLYIMDWENILVGHEEAEMGYGGSPKTFEASDGTKFRVNTVYVGSWDSDFIHRGFVWHEHGHNWGATHGDAVHDVNGGLPCNGAGVATDLTVMGWSYFETCSGAADTTVGGTGTTPSEWANGYDNNKYGFNSHLTEFSDYAVQSMNSWLCGK